LRSRVAFKALGTNFSLRALKPDGANRAGIAFRPLKSRVALWTLRSGRPDIPFWTLRTLSPRKPNRPLFTLRSLGTCGTDRPRRSRSPRRSRRPLRSRITFKALGTNFSLRALM